MEAEYHKGRGAQIKTSNPFLKQEYVTEHIEGIDEEMIGEKIPTQIFYENPKKIVNKVDSPDVRMYYSLNPYQGCEHGCIYCYARKTHEYWGYNAGLDFETKIIVKKNAPELLEKHLLQRSWKPQPIMLSGNTDCYQPIERKLGITRRLLEVFLKYRHPVGIITKNVTVLRDLDILEPLAKERLVHVVLSITSLDEKLRSVLEPRTASAHKKLKAIEELSKAGIPVTIMNAPIIPGLNHHEIPKVIKAAAEHGALGAGYTIVRLNGYIGEVFEDWLRKNFPDRFDKVWNQISEVHGGHVNDSQFGRRMRGEGNIADIIAQLFNSSRSRYMAGREIPPFDLTKFRKGGNYSLF
ncbi:PA0069 family radical SAM protein [Fulvivirga kasyanovii]|uniref:PA0069 family radical SAM protein n=1 Tax=Fulvivirga kasyanovii TaxID=396812 RepID=A0ABW9RZ32_9BACT|nr:PA0069 family radical SAM protein [Fulvivirga kasyanovii]MTI29007.1 PA0069 family radical SAM protein [Fulvivirga kasyanovii]